MTTRRSHGRGYIEPLPSGSFRAVMPAGMDLLTGRRRSLRETAPTLPEAEKALTRLQRMVDEKQHPKTSITVGEAIEQWLEVAKLEETTRDRYEDLIRLYITPHLGHLQAGGGPPRSRRTRPPTAQRRRRDPGHPHRRAGG